MHNIQPRPVKTGGDPRSFPDFVALREEMAKLTHPARPDVNWKLAEALSLSLFETNGVELQTGAWYTLARSHLGRVSGMNEGLTLLTALLSHQWAQHWPQQAHARAEILNGLFQRLQKLFRTFSLNQNDRIALEQAEKVLETMNDILARQSLKHACQTASLIQQVRGALTRLENGFAHEDTGPAVVLPPQALGPMEEEEQPVSRLVYVIRPEPEVNVQIVHDIPSPTRWSAFLAGACSALVVGALATGGWYYAQRVDEATAALSASVAALPQAVSPGQLQSLKTRPGLDPTGWLNEASSQLKRLDALPPDWAWQYGNALVNQAWTLWPERQEVAELHQQWQQRLAESTLPPNALTGWHNGMQQLQVLVDKLNALDGQKGKYITVSELKSSVFGMMRSFSQTVPLEEQLRVLESQQGDAAMATRQHIQRHLNGVIQAYSAQAGEKERHEQSVEIKNK